MACGLPCVSVNCKTGPAEILNEDFEKCSRQDQVYQGDYGIITPIFTGEKNLQPDCFTKEEEIFAEEMRKLLQDGALWAHYREQAVRRAGDFGMEAYVSNIEMLIK